MADGKYRMNISISSGIKERMDSVESKVNWSRVAESAFESELKYIELRKGKPMTEMIERLQKSKRQYEDEQEKRGLEIGIEFARKHASYEDLVKIEKYAEEKEGEWDAQELHWILVPSGNHADMIRFYFDDLENDTPDINFMSGFCEGVVGEFEKVKPELP